MRIIGCAETLVPGRRPVSAAKELGVGSRGTPGVSDDNMSIKNIANESTEPLAGRLGVAVRMHSEGISYKRCP